VTDLLAWAVRDKLEQRGNRCTKARSAQTLTPTAGSVPKFVAQKPNFVKIRSDSLQIEKVFREKTTLTNCKARVQTTGEGG
jgi:hypothetical protein